MVRFTDILRNTLTFSSAAMLSFTAIISLGGF